MIAYVFLLVSLLAAGLSAWKLPAALVGDISQSSLTATSLMVGAIFVRLNRGIPSLEWKNLDPLDRKKLTKSIVKLTTDYVRALIYAVIFVVVLLFGIGLKQHIKSLNYQSWQGYVLSFVFGLFGMILLLQMGYVVWRDLDIIKLQKNLIDRAADKEEAVLQRETAEGHIKKMQDSQVKFGILKPAKGWEES